MKKFLVIYRAPVSAREQMVNASPEQAKAGMDAWMRWAREAGDAIVDLGAPLDDGTIVGAGSAPSGSSKAVGYSILQAESMDAVKNLLRDHPHGHMPNFAVEVFECIAMPGEITKAA